MLLRHHAMRFHHLADSVLDRWSSRAWISYALVAALQLKILWGLWWYRDLTTGDTSSYFLTAYRWYESFANNILWSPLYTSFYGVMLQLFNDVYAATTAHRLLIVTCATLGVLALARRILPPGYALLVAIWWAALPINFNTLYEVHLFAALPIIGILIVATLPSTPFVRGCILASLVATTVLVRNEYIIATALFAGAALFYEIWFAHAETPSFRMRRLLLGYGGPMAIAMLVCAVFYVQSDMKFPTIWASSNQKHTLNMCQIYAVGYSQRHEWTLSPWTECYGLMETTFGMRLPTMGQMLIANPSETIAHLLWNISLIPHGLQVALFNGMSGTVNPDYVHVASGQYLPLLLSLAAVAALVGAFVVCMKDRARCKEYVVRHIQFIAVASAIFVVAVVVMAMQRPRASYFFVATALMMIVLSGAVWLLNPRRVALVNRAAIAIGILMLIAYPPFFKRFSSSRPLYQNIVNLEPYKPLLRATSGKILIGDYEGEIRNYLRIADGRTRTLDYGVLKMWSRETPLTDFLSSQSIDVFFVQPRILAELRSTPTAMQLLNSPESVGWTRLAPSGQSDWMLFAKAATSGR